MKSSHKVDIVIILLIATIAGPVVLRLYCYYFNQKSPSSGDLLGYYGTVIAATLATCGVFITLKDNKKEFVEQQRVSVLPFIAVDVLTEKKRIPIFNNGEVEIKSNINKEKNTYYYHEEKLKECFCIINNGKCTLFNGLTNDQIDRVINQGNPFKQKEPGKFVLEPSRVVYLPIELENVGIGAAINFRLGIFPEGGSQKYIKPIPMKVGDKFYCGVYLDEDSDIDFCAGVYHISIYYQDVIGNGYKQDNQFILEKNSDGKYYARINCASVQDRVKYI